MGRLAEYLETIGPELMNTARLFGMEKAVGDLTAETTAEGTGLRMIPEEGEGEYRITFTDGTDAVSRHTPVPEAEDPRVEELHRKRAARRLCKQTLYDFCKMKTGIQPPWGSLTGVRPTHLMLEALAQIILKLSGSELAGPIGVAQMAGEVAQMGFVPLLNFAAFLSLNLGIVNLFPIPALDGGHFVTLCVEAVRGKPMSPKALEYTQKVGIVLLILLMVLATKNDIVRVFTGG